MPKVQCQSCQESFIVSIEKIKILQENETTVLCDKCSNYGARKPEEVRFIEGYRHKKQYRNMLLQSQE